MALDGGTPTTFASGFSGDGGGVAVNGTTVYFFDGAALVSVPLAGGAPTPLATGLDEPRSIALDATHVYWTAEGGKGAPETGALMKVPPAGGTPDTLVSGLTRPFGLAVDSTSVYWAGSEAPEPSMAPARWRGSRRSERGGHEPLASSASMRALGRPPKVVSVGRQRARPTGRPIRGGPTTRRELAFPHGPFSVCGVRVGWGNG